MTTTVILVLTEELPMHGDMLRGHDIRSKRSNRQEAVNVLSQSRQIFYTSLLFFPVSIKFNLEFTLR
jgi:hypothetical protein